MDDRTHHRASDSNWHIAVRAERSVDAFAGAEELNGGIAAELGFRVERAAPWAPVWQCVQGVQYRQHLAGILRHLWAWCFPLHAAIRVATYRPGRQNCLPDIALPATRTSRAADNNPVSGHPDVAILSAFLRPLCGRRAAVIASDLLQTFKTLAGVLRANPAELDRQLGSEHGAAALLLAVRPLMHEMLRAELLNGPVLPDLQATLDYLFVNLAHQQAEHVVMLYLDAKNRLLADEVVARGTITRADIFPREVVRRALDLGATGLIMAHNHPSGDPTPSRSDLDATRTVAEAGRLFDIILHDHIVIGRSGHCSLRDEGYL
ncbi:MAG: DNA repair protein RadC [Rhizorhabdus sp.]